MTALAKRIGIGVDDRRELERIVRSRTAERRAVERARIVLAAAEGRPAARIAGEVGCRSKRSRSGGTVSRRTVLPGCGMRPGPGRAAGARPAGAGAPDQLACTRPTGAHGGLRREHWTQSRGTQPSR